jgi:phenylalanyl-tRNA synthetase beta chain
VPAPMLTLKERITDLLVGCGMQEVITYSLGSQATLDKVDPQKKLGPALRVANPMSSEQEYLRTSLRARLLATFASNEKHEKDGIKLFEASRVYLPRANNLPEEREMLAGVLGGPQLDRSWLSGEDTLDFFDAKGILETLFNRLKVKASFEPAEDQILLAGKTAEIVVEGQRIGVVGEVHPTTAASFDISTQPIILFEIDLAKLLPFAGVGYRYRLIPRFPGNSRDIALILDTSIAASKVEETIKSFPLVDQVTLFDVYTGEQLPQSKKSLAFSIRFQSAERTLTDEEVNKAQDEIIKRLQREFGAILRS